MIATNNVSLLDDKYIHTFPMKDRGCCLNLVQPSPTIIAGIYNEYHIIGWSAGKHCRLGMIYQFN